MFNYVYLLGIRNRLEDNIRKSFGSIVPTSTVVATNVTDRGYAPVQEQRINDLVKPKTGGLQALRDANPEIDFDTDWNTPQFEGEMDHSAWLDRYQQEREQDRPDEYPFQDFNYGP